MKKMLVLALSIMLFLSGCGSSGASAPTSTDKKQETASESAKETTEKETKEAVTTERVTT